MSIFVWPVFAVVCACPRLGRRDPLGTLTQGDCALDFICVDDGISRTDIILAPGTSAPVTRPADASSLWGPLVLELTRSFLLIALLRIFLFNLLRDIGVMRGLIVAP